MTKAEWNLELLRLFPHDTSAPRMYFALALASEDARDAPKAADYLDKAIARACWALPGNR